MGNEVVENEKIKSKNKRLFFYIFITILLVIAFGYFINPNVKTVDAKIDIDPNIEETKLTKLIQYKQPRIDPIISREIASAIIKYSNEFELPPAFIVSIIDKESSFRPISISSKNCKGLMQIHKKFHEEKLDKFGIKGDEIFYIKNNIRVGCAIIREYYDQTGSISKTLAKYYGADDPNYIYSVLSSFADLTIKHKSIENDKLNKKQIKEINNS